MLLEEHMRHKLILGTALLILGLFVTSAEAAGSAAAQKIKYPPYPEVWDWQEPNAEIHYTTYESLLLMQNGDVLIPYEKKTTKKGKPVDHAATFFGKKTFVGADAKKIIDAALKNSRSQYNAINRVYGKDLSREAMSTVGTMIIKSEFSYDLHCYAGPNRYPYSLTNKITNQTKTFSIFQLLEKPEKFFVNGVYGEAGTDEEDEEYPNATCQYERRRTVRYMVKSVSGSFLFLANGEFLFRVDEAGDVIRFDAELKSKSKLVGDRYFLIENNAGPSVMNLLQKDYTEEDGDKETEDLYRYLQSIRRR
jgi:hypothetical protein